MDVLFYRFVVKSKADLQQGGLFSLLSQDNIIIDLEM